MLGLPLTGARAGHRPILTQRDTNKYTITVEIGERAYGGAWQGIPFRDKIVPFRQNFCAQSGERVRRT